MAGTDHGWSVRRLTRRVREAGSALKAEYEAGTRGDDSPTEPIFPTPAQQWAALTALLTGSRQAADPTDADRTDADVRADVADAGADADVADPEALAAEQAAQADEVASALRRVDWQQVRAATAQRTGAAADAMRSMAREVDWAKVQPVAAQVSSALIAAVASGRVPVAGRMGPLVAKALTDQGVLAQRIGTSLARDQGGLPPDFRADLQRAADVVEATATEMPVAPLPRRGGSA